MRQRDTAEHAGAVDFPETGLLATVRGWRPWPAGATELLMDELFRMGGLPVPDLPVPVPDQERVEPDIEAESQRIGDRQERRWRPAREPVEQVAPLNRLRQLVAANPAALGQAAIDVGMRPATLQAVLDGHAVLQRWQARRLKRWLGRPRPCR